MTPVYPHPPEPNAPPPARVRARRAGGRILAAAWRTQTPSEGRANDRILLIRPDHLGDILFLGPALRWLRAHTDAHLTLAIGPWSRPALPALAGCYDDLIEIPFPGFERGERAGLRRRWSLAPQTARALRRSEFDSAVIFRPDHWWGAMSAALAHIPTRLGYAAPETTPWLTQALTLPHEHAAASNLRLAAALLPESASLDPLAQPLAFTPAPDDRREARALVSSLPVAPGQPLVTIHPGAGAAIKRWDSAKWGEVARRLSDEGCRVVITGGPDETALTAAVAAAADGAAIDLGGRTSFGVLAALLAISDLVLGPDSGPLNLAVAVDAATIHLFGPADPLLFGPWGDPERHVVLRSNWRCVPCGRFDWPDLPEHGCVRDITVSQIMDAARPLLAGDLTAAT